MFLQIRADTVDTFYVDGIMSRTSSVANNIYFHSGFKMNIIIVFFGRPLPIIDNNLIHLASRYRFFQSFVNFLGIKCGEQQNESILVIRENFLYD